MLWYRSWLETRWRFVIGLALLPLSAAASVLAYRRLISLLPLASGADPNDPIGRKVLEAVEVMGTYRGYIWTQWFETTMSQQWAFFAVLLGLGGLLAQSSGGGALFTLSLPATRDRLVGVRAATGLVELLILAFVPSILITVLSPAIGERYSLVDALAHATFMFIVGSLFFSSAFLLSTVFSDVWRPLLIVACIGGVIGFAEEIGEFSGYGLFGLMSGERYFRGQGVPWIALMLSVVLSSVLLVAASRNIARQDF
jgi:hypothetical protein